MYSIHPFKGWTETAKANYSRKDYGTGNIAKETIDIISYLEADASAASNSPAPCAIFPVHTLIINNDPNVAREVGEEIGIGSNGGDAYVSRCTPVHLLEMCSRTLLGCTVTPSDVTALATHQRAPLYRSTVNLSASLELLTPLN